MSALVGGNPGEVLSSWKEIASYVNRGVRTVQRWEAELGMPVHRPASRSRTAVMAFRSEIDQWVRTGGAATGGAPEPSDVRIIPYTSTTGELIRSILKCQELCAKTHQHLKSVSAAVEQYATTVRALRASREKKPLPARRDQRAFKQASV